MIRYVLISAIILLCACSKQQEAVATPPGDRAPKTPHGGIAVDLGDYNLETLVDQPKGTLEIYVLDDDLENFIRIAQTQMIVSLNDQGDSTSLTLEAIANPATGETVGSTSYFAGSSEWIKTHPHFQAVASKVVIRASEFNRVSFTYPP